MKRNRIKKCSAMICLVLLLSTFFAVPASANSAQTHWVGTTSTGAIVTDEDCPIIVENELLTFDIQEFPVEYYAEVSDYLAYNGKVTAEYTFYNPADYEVTATLVFPFGTVPHYGWVRDPETEEYNLTADTEKYDVSVDGMAIEKTLRHTLSFYGSQFELEADMARLHDGFMEDEFYSLDMPVTRYTYVPDDVDTETYKAANAAFVLSADSSKTKVLMNGQSGGKLLEDGVQLECWVEEGKFIVNVIGEPLEQMPDWKFYENGACEKEIDGTMTLVGTETTTLKEFVLSQYDADSGVLDYDWYNAIVESLKCYEWQYGAIHSTEVSFDVSGELMRWYEYEITLAPGERIVNTVTAPMYPSIDSDYEPDIYKYTYLLSPAQSWAGFGNLDIEINTPYYITESSQEGFEKTDVGYILHLTALPEGELTFTLSASESPETPAKTITDYIPIEMIISFSIIGGVILLIGVGVFVLVRRKRCGT